jgi:lipopolysaccharide export system permease protein
LIIFRYFTKEVLQTLIAVTVVLLLVFLANQIVRWLNEAASGDIASTALIHLVLLELPYLLGLLLPLGLYLGILITYSRLYVENEMTVLFASGMSQWQLLNMTLSIASIVFVVVLALVCWVNPMIAVKQTELLNVSAKNVVGTLIPGHFQSISHDSQVVYVESLATDKKSAKNVFIAQMPTAGASDADWVILSAAKGHQEAGELPDESYVVTEEGYRYQGTPGTAAYQITQFQQYGVKVPSVTSKHSVEEQAIPMADLIKHRHDNLAYFSELQWRLALPISVFLLAVLAMLISRVQPRHGRFAKLVPAIMIYIVYANLIFIGRDWLESEKMPAIFGLWWVHGVMLLLILQVAVWQWVRGRR